MRSIAVVQLIAWVASAVAGTGVNETRCTQIQHSFSAHAHGNAARAEAVKQAYLRSWNQYVSAGFGLDTLQPLTNTTTNDMSGWGVTIVDALDTAIVMGLTDVAAKQLEWIANVDMSYVPSLRRTPPHSTLTFD
jgi:mannosyl-oligosaccharide alpha-1,2-mannosidase